MRTLFVLIMLLSVSYVSYSQEQLSHAVVSARKNPVSISSGIIEYNVELDSLATFKSLSSIVASLPLVLYDEKDRQLSIDGSSNICVILNGRKSLILNSSNYSYVAEVLRGGQINSIRIDTHPEGNFREYSAVLDIRTKDSLSDFYSIGFEISGSDKVSVTPSSGLTGKIGRLTANIKYIDDWADAKPVITETTGKDAAGRTIYESSDTTTMGISWSHSPEIKLSYDISDNDVLFIGGKGSFLNSQSQLISSDERSGNKKSLECLKDINANDIDASVEYQHNFGQAYDKLLTLQYTLTRSENTSACSVLSYLNTTLDRQHAFSADYSHAISDFASWNATASFFSRRYNSLDQSISLLDQIQNVCNLKAESSLRKGNLLFNGVIGYEYAFDNAFINSLEEPLSDADGTLNFSLRTNYFIKAGHSAMLLLSKQAFRPDIRMRNPFRDESLSGAVSQGNPELSCQNTYQFILTYMYMKGMKFSSSTMLSGLYSPDGIYSISSVLEDGRILNSFANGFRTGKIFLSESIMWNPSSTISINASYRIAWCNYRRGEEVRTSFVDHFANIYARWNPWKDGSLSTSLIVANPYTGLLDGTQATELHYTVKGGINFFQQLSPTFSIGVYVNDPWTHDIRESFEYRVDQLKVFSTRICPGRVIGATVRYTVGHFKGSVKTNNRHVTDSDRIRQ